MLIARSPVRLSLAGGGTDLPAYYERFGGSVISTTINKYFYVLLEPVDDDCLQISSSDFQTFYRLDRNERGEGQGEGQGELELPREVLRDFGVDRGVSMFLASEIPPGTGLGSSSSVAVGIIKAIATALDMPLDRAALAERACRIEIDRLQAPIGKQDQYATAFGGLNWIEFGHHGVDLHSVELPAGVSETLQRNLMLFYTGSTRSASKILRETTARSRDSDRDVIDALHEVKAMSVTIRDVLLDGDLSSFGTLLHETWQRKKRFASSVSNPTIDDAYDAARRAGALGGKIAGAGGGGFLMIYAEPEQQESVTRALAERSLRRMDYRFESQGAQVLMNTGVSILPPLVAADVTASGRTARLRPRSAAAALSAVES